MWPRSEVNVDAFDSIPARALIANLCVYHIAIVYDDTGNTRGPLVPHIAPVARHDATIAQWDINQPPHRRPVAWSNKKMEYIALRADLRSDKVRVP